jgi:hypothetical protein
MGPMPRTTALSIEHRMKRFVFRGGGLNGRIKALTKLLSLSQHRTASVLLTQSDLQQIPVLITMSREQFQRTAAVDDEWIQQRRIQFSQEL